MKKNILNGLLTLSLALSAVVMPSAAHAQNISVTLNDSEIAFDQPPIIQGGRTLVPFRAIFEALGADVSWDGDSETVTASNGGKTVSLAIGSNVMQVDSSSVELDVPAQIVNDRTLVPVRAVSEAFDCDVSWDQSAYKVSITTADYDAGYNYKSNFVGTWSDGDLWQMNLALENDKTIAAASISRTRGKGYQFSIDNIYFTDDFTLEGYGVMSFVDYNDVYIRYEIYLYPQNPNYIYVAITNTSTGDKMYGIDFYKVG